MALPVTKTTDVPAVLLAPLAGITDLPFRALVSGFGAGLVVSEMIASQEMVQAKPGAREKAELGFGSANTAVQLAGREAIGWPRPQRWSRRMARGSSTSTWAVRQRR